MGRVELAQAVQLALDNAAAGRSPFGAVLVRDGKVVATGVNTELPDHDPTAHAEVAAVRNACRQLGVLHLGGAVIYSSCEPCALCVAAAAAAGVSQIVYAAPKEFISGLQPPPPLPVVVYEETPGAREPFGTRHHSGEVVASAEWKTTTSPE